jgi:hypothetical protein
VIFDPLTSRVMYTWHWNESFWKQISIELPFHPIAHRYYDPINELQSYVTHNQSWIAQKQSLIRQYVFQLQYSLAGYEEKYQYTSAIPYVELVMNSTNTHSRPNHSTLNAEESRKVMHEWYGRESNVSYLQVMKEDDIIVYEARKWKHSTASTTEKVQEQELKKSVGSGEKSLRGGAEDGEGEGKSFDEAVEWVSYASSNWPVDNETRKPMLDAYDITMNYVLGWHSGELERVRNATVPECWDGWLDVQANKCRPGKEPGKETPAKL